MAIYRVQVVTGNACSSGIFDSISLTLVGTEGESPKTILETQSPSFCQSLVREIILLRLQREDVREDKQDSLYCDFVVVTSAEEVTYRFPCYQWIEHPWPIELREGTAKTPSMDHLPRLQQHRKEELKQRQQIFRWVQFRGCPEALTGKGTGPPKIKIETQHCKNESVFLAMVAILTFLTNTGLSNAASLNPGSQKSKAGFPLCMSGASNVRRHKNASKIPSNSDISAFLSVFLVPEHVTEYWKRDEFFGYQFLHGLNPIIIQLCTQIPNNFPVTQTMVAGLLGDSTTLQEELNKQRIFLVDYKILEGLSAGLNNGRLQHIAAPLCLLHLSSEGHLMPLAIQLSQSSTSPIFLPSDPEWDWILAKTWVRNSDFHIHQGLTHLLRTHLLAEVFTMATLRQLPMCHPLYKLLIPHIRFTLHINTLARTRLIPKGGLLQKGMASIMYSSLCLPEDIKARGMSSLPNYHYRDDGLKIWAAIESFVSNMVDLYYKADDSVQKDYELQSWIYEIFQKGFLALTSSGIPSSFSTVEEVKKFITMVIYTCSAQHTAVNAGQFDFGAWMPNFPSAMRKPPPKTKGQASLKSYKETIPEINTTANIISVLWLLSAPTGDRIPLGKYPDRHFTEKAPLELITTFQPLTKQDPSLLVAYKYLDPAEMENSVSI
uniref:Arachidonate 15-lipoxygenase type B n=1 Tax=Pseudonaja textilis TaxID=8673 RepID=A0A670ZEN3_PSETE